MLLATSLLLRIKLTVNEAWSIHSKRTILSSPVPDRDAEHEIEGKEYRVEDNEFGMLTIERLLWLEW